MDIFDLTKAIVHNTDYKVTLPLMGRVALMVSGISTHTYLEYSGRSLMKTKVTIIGTLSTRACNSFAPKPPHLRPLLGELFNSHVI